MKKLTIAALALMLVLAVTISFALTSRAHAANNSEQVVFSGVAFSPTAPTPAGFWVWCESDSTNPYLGVCSGAMYFYALGITKGVGGSVAEGPSGIYTMSVSSRDGIVSCTLKNVAPPTSGPTNTVNVTCTAPLSFSVQSPNAVVTVTGP